MIEEGEGRRDAGRDIASQNARVKWKQAEERATKGAPAQYALHRPFTPLSPSVRSRGLIRFTFSNAFSQSVDTVRLAVTAPNHQEPLAPHITQSWRCSASSRRSSPWTRDSSSASAFPTHPRTPPLHAAQPRQRSPSQGRPLTPPRPRGRLLFERIRWILLADIAAPASCLVAYNALRLQHRTHPPTQAVPHEAGARARAESLRAAPGAPAALGGARLSESERTPPGRPSHALSLSAAEDKLTLLINEMARRGRPSSLSPTRRLRGCRAAADGPLAPSRRRRRGPPWTPSPAGAWPP